MFPKIPSPTSRFGREGQYSPWTDLPPKRNWAWLRCKYIFHWYADTVLQFLHLKLLEKLDNMYPEGDISGSVRKAMHQLHALKEIHTERKHRYQGVVEHSCERKGDTGQQASPNWILLVKPPVTLLIRQALSIEQWQKTCSTYGWALEITVIAWFIFVRSFFFDGIPSRKYRKKKEEAA